MMWSLEMVCLMIPTANRIYLLEFFSDIDSSRCSSSSSSIRVVEIVL